MIIIKGDKVSLSRVEQDICLAISKLRFTNNRIKNISNSKIGPQSDEFTDLEGIGAELAFAKLSNTYPDFSINTRSSSLGTDYGDLKLHNNQSVDVKTTKYNSGKLLAVLWKTEVADLMVLMVGKFPNYEFRGCMKSCDLLIPERIGDLGYGKTYMASQNELVDLII